MDGNCPLSISALFNTVHARSGGLFRKFDDASMTACGKGYTMWSLWWALFRKTVEIESSSVLLKTAISF